MAKKNKKDGVKKNEKAIEKSEEPIVEKNDSGEIIGGEPFSPPKQVTNKNCECRKIGRWWYCMKQDNMGHMVLCDGPFQTQAECDELAICDE